MLGNEMERTLQPADLEKLKTVLRKHNMKALAECEMARRRGDLQILTASNALAGSTSTNNEDYQSQLRSRGEGDTVVKTSGGSTLTGRKWPSVKRGPFRRPNTVDASDRPKVNPPGGNTTTNVQPSSWAEAADIEDTEKAKEISTKSMATFFYNNH